jgi:hypothetical protein
VLLILSTGIEAQLLIITGFCLHNSHQMILLFMMVTFEIVMTGRCGFITTIIVAITHFSFFTFILLHNKRSIFESAPLMKTLEFRKGVVSN